MSLEINAVQQACRAIAIQMRDYSRSLHLSFIVHQNGEKLESLSMAGQQLLTHPAGESAIRLMRDQSQDEYCSYLGIAIWHQRAFFGLIKEQQMMALSTINIDSFDSLREIRAQVWHMAWHAIRHYQLRNKPEYGHFFDAGMVAPLYDEDSLPSANLRADIFSTIMCNIEGDRDAVRRLAHHRCLNALSRNHNHRPEDYPFALVLDATQAALNDILKAPPSKKREIESALNLTEKIAREYDDEALKHWIYFCKPAQEMIWRGNPADIVLGAAVCTSQNTYTRTTGFLVSDLMHIAPASILSLDGYHNTFAEDRYNQRLHQSMIEAAFEKAATAGMSSHNGMPFIEAANQQNKHLSEGHIFGWCAVALQAAGRAFDSAVASGSKTPALAAWEQFEQEQHRTTWDNLKELGETIIEQYRYGYAVTFSDILEFCGTEPAFAGISSSIAFTLKDPGYLKKLRIANDISTPQMKASFIPAAAAPRAPAPATPHAPAPHRGIPGFSPSGGGATPQRKIPTAQDPAPAAIPDPNHLELDDQDNT